MQVYDKSSSFQKYAPALLAHGPVGLALFAVDDFRLLAMNAAYEQMLGTFAQSDKPMLHIGDTPTPWEQGLAAAGIPALFKTVIQTGLPSYLREFAMHSSTQGVSYWDWFLEPIVDEHNTVVQLHLTAYNATQRVLELQQAQHEAVLLVETQRIAQREQQRLEVVETVARSVRESLDIERVGKAVVDLIRDHFSTLRVAVHTADAPHQVLQLLHAYTAPGNEATFSSLQRVPYASQLLIAQARHSSHPLVIEDAQTAQVDGIIELGIHTLRQHIRGYVCVPLYFADCFEGTLTAVFENPISSDGPEVQTLTDCGMHIAAALAHARIHGEVERERLHLHQVLDHLPEGVLILTAPHAQIRYANEVATRIFGLSLATLKGKDATWLGQQTALASTDKLVLSPTDYSGAMALRGEMVRQRESLIRRPDGSVVVTLASTVPLCSSDGEIIETVSVFQDITERKSVEQQKNEFLSIASHELRTPITSILAYAEILQRLLSDGVQIDGERLRRATTVMIEQSHYLTRMIEELLELSSIETARLSLHLERYDLIVALRNMLENQTFITKKHHLHLVLDVPPSTETLIGLFDKGRMEQVLNNLLNNAIKYSATGSEIEVGLRSREHTPGEVLIWVKDHGIGIAAEDLHHIFDRFHRVNSLDRSITGFGIGLYLVKEFITRHHGQVWVESAVGEGSTFWIRLPL